jgi:hypothetical protein
MRLAVVMEIGWINEKVTYGLGHKLSTVRQQTLHLLQHLLAEYGHQVRACHGEHASLN